MAQKTKSFFTVLALLLPSHLENILCESWILRGKCWPPLTSEFHLILEAGHVGQVGEGLCFPLLALVQMDLHT